MTGADDGQELKPVTLEFDFAGDPGAFIDALRSAIRAPRPVHAVREEPPRWVLVKGHHDSGTIAGVLGPYTEAHADWLISSVLDCSSYNWTKAKLDSGPEEP